MKVIVSTVVQGGSTTCSVVGPKVIPLGLDVNKVVADINEITEKLKTSVKIDILVNTDNKTYEIMIPKPKTTDLIKTYCNPDNKTISSSNLFRIMEILNNKNKDKALKELQGTCKSMHIKVV